MKETKRGEKREREGENVDFYLSPGDCINKLNENARV